MNEFQEEPVLIQYTKNKPKILSKNDDGSSEGEGQLTCDVYQTEDDVVIQSAIAGVLSDDLDIHITTDMVTIRGARHRSNEDDEREYFAEECFWGRFSRSIVLPQAVDADEVTAVLKNGILTIRVPKTGKEREKPMKLKIKLGH